MKKIIFILLTLFPFVASADIYVSTDQQGNPHFSDIPAPDAKPMPVAEAQSYIAPKLPAIEKAKPIANKIVKPLYKELRIVKPVNQETMVGNKHGDLIIKVAVQPKLKGNDKFRLLMDKKELLTTKQNIFKLKNIDRGSHVLQAQIIDAQGKVLIESPSITFYIQRSKVKRHK